MDEQKTGPAAYAAVRGITRTSDEAGQVQNTFARHLDSLVLFAVALVPPIVLCLVRGLSGAGASIPYASLWAWGAVVVALVVAGRSALPLLAGGAVGSVAALAGAVVLLLVPAVVVLVLELQPSPVALRVGIAAMVLYGAGAVALLLGRLGERGR